MVRPARVGTRLARNTCFVIAAWIRFPWDANSLREALRVESSHILGRSRARLARIVFSLYREGGSGWVTYQHCAHSHCILPSTFAIPPTAECRRVASFCAMRIHSIQLAASPILRPLHESYAGRWSVRRATRAFREAGALLVPRVNTIG